MEAILFVILQTFFARLELTNKTKYLRMFSLPSKALTMYEVYFLVFSGMALSTSKFILLPSQKCMELILIAKILGNWGISSDIHVQVKIFDCL